jgi:hypothetical protein
MPGQFTILPQIGWPHIRWLSWCHVHHPSNQPQLRVISTTMTNKIVYKINWGYMWYWGLYYTQFQNNCAFGWFVWGETQFKITIISWSLRLTDHISTAHLVLFAYHIGFPELFGSIIPQEPPWCCWGLREETLVNSGIGLFFSVFPHWYMPKPDPQYIHGSSYIYIYM